MHTNDSDKTNIIDLTKEQLLRWLDEQNIRSYRASQIFKWLYLRYVDDFDQMTDLLKETRNRLKEQFSIRHLQCKVLERSEDGSMKYLFELSDRLFVESVLIPEKKHYTLCISTQVGCAQGCRFCLTGAMGFRRNLSKGEILGQIIHVLKHFPGDEEKTVRNVVLMGMGEPLANYRNVISALDTMTDEECGLKIASRRITLSTVGLVPKILSLGKDSKVNIAISLNAVDNGKRSRLMPVNDTYPIESLLEVCCNYPLNKGRKITFEYILMKDVNDSVDDARKLAKLLRPVPSKINLIPYNPHIHSPFERPEEARIEAFHKVLLDANYTVIVRESKGKDIGAACGQLGAALNNL